MKQYLEKKIKIPEGVEIQIDSSTNTVSVRSEGKELKREFNTPNIKILNEGKELKIFSENATRREGKIIGTTVAHINNLIRGIKEEFEYHLEICSVHFPMTVRVDKDKITIKNFLGEKVDRTCKVLPNVKVDIKGNQITVTSSNREAAGQTSANIEKCAKVRGRDRRVFQDGIFITKKPGRNL